MEEVSAAIPELILKGAQPEICNEGAVAGIWGFI